MKKAGAVICVLLAGTLWGCMSLFVRRLNEAGLDAMDVVQLRILTGLVLVGGYLALFQRDKLKVMPRDLWIFFGTGVVSLLLFTLCYFSGMAIASVSVMCVLLYTAPVFVMLLSLLLFREKLTKRKLTALGLCVAGCFLVSGVIGGGETISGKGLLLGVLSGFFYALYSIFSRYAIRRNYDSWTITFYTFLFCVLGASFFCDWKAMGTALGTVPSLWLWVLVMGLTTGFLAYLLYTKGLEGMESSRASILASIEPVVAGVVGLLVFHESLSVLQLCGIAAVLGAVGVLSLGKKA